MLDGTRRCARCGVTKMLTEFYRNRKAPDGRTSYCTRCSGEAKKEWRTANPAKARAVARATHLKQYDMTPLEYEERLNEQQGACLLCGKPPTESRPLVVDHDHATGRVRGLLCHLCNLALGGFADDPNRLEQAARYLRGVA